MLLKCRSLAVGYLTDSNRSLAVGYPIIICNILYTNHLNTKTRQI